MKDAKPRVLYWVQVCGASKAGDLVIPYKEGGTSINPLSFTLFLAPDLFVNYGIS